MRLHPPVGGRKSKIKPDDGRRLLPMFSSDFESEIDPLPPGSQGQQRRSFELPALPYEFKALEPVLDPETLYWHHEVHHRAYVERLNEVVNQSPVLSQLMDLGVTHVFRNSSKMPEEIRSLLGGHWNHEFFWRSMTERQDLRDISRTLRDLLDESFGSLEEFQRSFIRIGMSHVGSGWLWLLKSGGSRLLLVTTGNCDNPLMDHVPSRGLPLLACDLWEHAYYLRYKARRELYLKRFCSVINWSRVHQLLIHGLGV